MLVTTPELSCTPVGLLEKEKVVVAYNYDWYPPFNQFGRDNPIIQHNLDRHNSVAEVLANAETVRPMSCAATIHYRRAKPGKNGERRISW